MPSSASFCSIMRRAPPVAIGYALRSTNARATQPVRESQTMTQMMLRLFEDRLPAGGDPVFLPALARACYVAAGDIVVEFAAGAARHEHGTAWLGEEAIAVLPGPA